MTPTPDLTVRRVMEPNPVVVEPGRPIQDALQAMNARRIGLAAGEARSEARPKPERTRRKIDDAQFLVAPVQAMGREIRRRIGRVQDRSRQSGSAASASAMSLRLLAMP